MNFKCGLCEKSFSFKSNLLRHARVKHKVFTFGCRNCKENFASEKLLEEHLIKHRTCFYCTKVFIRPGAARAHEKLCSERLKNLDDAENETKTFCSTCDKFVLKRFYFAHERSVEHMEKLMQNIGERIFKYESCFKNACATFRIKCEEEHKMNSRMFLEDVKRDLRALLEQELAEREGSLKFRLSLMTLHHRQTSPDEEFEQASKHFNCKYRVLTMGDDIDAAIEKAYEDILAEAEEFSHMHSGWSLLENLFVLINILTFRLSGGGRFIELPKKLAKKNALVNVRNVDQKCF